MALSRRALLASGAALGLPGAIVDLAVAMAQSGPRIREDIAVFSKDSNKVASLRAAVGRMKARSKANRDDPLGWYYWYAVHSTVDTPPSDLTKIYRQCDHTSGLPPSYLAQHFISWHRAFLLYFEAALKAAAKEVGATDINLPYWNWYDDGNVPAILTSGDANSNTLWHDRANTFVNPRALDRGFFKNHDLLPSSVGGWASSFSVPLEFNPHGTVHGTIGKDMGRVPTSARDPVFWVHHCNIDRLWSAWINMGGRNNPPAGSPWRTKSFVFDKAGAMTATAESVLETDKLGYRYDNLVPYKGAPPLTGAVVAESMKIEANPVASGGGTVRSGTLSIAGTTAISRTASSITLGGHSVSVDMKVAAPARTQLRSLALGTTPASGAITGAWLVLENVEILGDGANSGFSFGIVARLPGGDRTVRLGELNSFNWPANGGTAGGHDHGALQPVTLTFPLSDVLKGLQAVSANALENGLRVEFEAAHPASNDRQFVKIGSMSVKTSTAPLQ